MATQVQNRRGSTAEHSTFTGAAGELTVDTDKDTVVVHDGSTAGGAPLMREDGSNSSLALGSAASPSLKWDANTGLYSPGADQVAISTNGTQRATIDSSGRLLVGTSTSITSAGTSGGGAGSTPALQVVHPYQNINPAGISLSRFQASNPYGAVFTIQKSRNDTIGSHTVVDSGDELGVISFDGSNGTAFNTAATISAVVDGTPGANDMPGRLTFSTTADGASSPTERMRITSDGKVGLGTSSPAGALHVDAASGVDGPVFDSGGTANSNHALLVRDSANNQLLRVNNDGKVGIGTTSPAEGLHINPSSDTYAIQIQRGNNDFQFGKIGQKDGIFSFLSDGYIANGQYRFSGSTNGGAETEYCRIDSSGRLLVGTSSARTNVAGSNGSAGYKVQVESSGTDGIGSLSLINNFSAGYPGSLAIGATGGSSVGSNTIVNNNEDIGIINFVGADGTNLIKAAAITAFVDGTPGTNDMPGRLVFSTTADAASSPTERMRIGSVGDIGVSNANHFYPTTDNVTSIGLSGLRWTSVWAANGTIQTSDQRAKADITDSQLGSDFIKSLRPVSYRWIEGGKRDTGERDEDSNYIYESVPGERTHWGFIAQEVKEAVDAAGVDFGGWVLTDKDDPDSQQALRYDQFIAPLTKALQEALAEIDILKAKVAALEAS